MFAVTDNRQGLSRIYQGILQKPVWLVVYVRWREFNHRLRSIKPDNTDLIYWQIFGLSSHSHDKGLWASTCSVRVSICSPISAPLPPEGFPWNFIMGTFMNICQATVNLVKVGQKYRTFYVRFAFAGYINLPWNIVVQHSVFCILRKVTCASTIHKKHSCIAVAIMVTRKCHSGTCYVSSLPIFLFSRKREIWADRRWDLRVVVVWA